MKDFAKSIGVDLVGVAGPDQLDGPPSTDAGYILRGGKSCVSFALPQNVDAIYDFLSKKGKTYLNIDRMKVAQLTNRTSLKIEEFLQSQGFKAKAVMANMIYRRTLNLKTKKPHPDFSHRFASIAAGIAGLGLSGNVVTEKYGAAVYLGTVITDAVFKSDPMMPPRHIMDNICSKCKICNHSCPAKMFVGDKEEYVLMNGQLLPRGFRRDISYCNINCFGLHSVSDNLKWSSWGSHIIPEYLNGVPETNGKNINQDFFDNMFSAGDSGSKYQALTTFVTKTWPEELFTRDKLGKEIEDYPEDELARRKVRSDDMKEYTGVEVADPDVSTCGQCALVCAGADIPESARRLRMLRESGIVVKRGDGRHAVVKTFEQAMEIMGNDPHIISKKQKRKEAIKQAKYGITHNFGFEPKGLIQNFFYQRKLKRAIAEQQPEDRLAQLEADRSAAGTKLIEELDQRPGTFSQEPVPSPGCGEPLSFLESNDP